jgi:MFS family permease
MLSLTSAALTAVQVGLIVFLFPLYAAVRAGVDATTVGLLVAVGVLGRLGALWIGGSAPDRERRFRLLVPGLVVYATLLALLGGLTHPLGLLAWNVATGAAAGLVMALPAALVGDLTPPPLQGVAIGWFRTVTDTGQIVGPLVLGGVADLVGLPHAFRSGALLLVLAAVGCWRLKRIVTSSTKPCPTR